jgi:GT2 family glycosyltransferase
MLGDPGPGLVIVVDSSQPTKRQDEFISILRSDFPATHFDLLRTSPGLPYQRRQGIELLRTLDTKVRIELVCFMDDDVLINSQDFFSNMSFLMQKYPNLIAISGDMEMEAPNIGIRFAQFLVGAPWRPGKLSKSGLTSIPRSVRQKEITCTEWIQGGVFGLRLVYGIESIFPVRTRMYGEDVEMSFELKRRFGSLGISSRLTCKHLQAKEGKSSEEQTAYFTTAFRFGFHSRTKALSFKRILLSTFLLMLVNLLSGLLLGSKDKLKFARGYYRAIVDLASGELYEDNVTGN